MKRFMAKSWSWGCVKANPWRTVPLEAVLHTTRASTSRGPRRVRRSRRTGVADDISSGNSAIKPPPLTFRTIPAISFPGNCSVRTATRREMGKRANRRPLCGSPFPFPPSSTTGLSFSAFRVARRCEICLQSPASEARSVANKAGYATTVRLVKGYQEKACPTDPVSQSHSPIRHDVTRSFRLDALLRAIIRLWSLLSPQRYWFNLDRHVFRVWRMWPARHRSFAPATYALPALHPSVRNGSFGFQGSLPRTFAWRPRSRNRLESRFRFPLAHQTLYCQPTAGVDSLSFDWTGIATCVTNEPPSGSRSPELATRTLHSGIRLIFLVSCGTSSPCLDIVLGRWIGTGGRHRPSQGCAWAT